MWSIICLRGNTRWNTTMAFSPLQLNTMCKSQPNVWTSLQSDLSGEQQQQSWTLNKKLNRHFFSEVYRPCSVHLVFCQYFIKSITSAEAAAGWPIATYQRDDHHPPYYLGTPVFAKLMIFLKKSEGGGGHFQRKNCCRYSILQNVNFGTEFWGKSATINSETRKGGGGGGGGGGSTAEDMHPFNHSSFLLSVL